MVLLQSEAALIICSLKKIKISKLLGVKLILNNMKIFRPTRRQTI